MSNWVNTLREQIRKNVIGEPGIIKHDINDSNEPVPKASSVSYTKLSDASKLNKNDNSRILTVPDTSTPNLIGNNGTVSTISNNGTLTTISNNSAVITVEPDNRHQLTDDMKESLKTIINELTIVRIHRSRIEYIIKQGYYDSWDKEMLNKIRKRYIEYKKELTTVSTTPNNVPTSTSSNLPKKVVSMDWDVAGNSSYTQFDDLKKISKFNTIYDPYSTPENYTLFDDDDPLGNLFNDSGF